MRFIPMKAFVAIALAAGVLVAAPAFASEELATAKKCTTCHKVDAKLIGPAYKDVAAKYKGQADAVAKLTQKVLDGGSGVWGPVPMTPNKGTVTPEEAKTLVTWVLSLK
jgi:cytochrome c